MSLTLVDRSGGDSEALDSFGFNTIVRPKVCNLYGFAIHYLIIYCLFSAFRALTTGVMQATCGAFQSRHILL